jgi:hypothetical protein
MEKETKLKLALFWVGVAISIIGWAASMCYVAYWYFSTHDVLQSQAICMGIILGTLFFAFFWALLFGSIIVLIKTIHILFKVLLLIYIALVVFLYSTQPILGFIAALPLSLICLTLIAVYIGDKNTRAYFRDISTKITLALSLAVAVLTFLLSLFIGITEGHIASRILLSCIFALIIASHVWVVYGMILYAKSIHKSIRES